MRYQQKIAQTKNQLRDQRRSHGLSLYTVGIHTAEGCTDLLVFWVVSFLEDQNRIRMKVLFKDEK